MNRHSQQWLRLNSIICALTWAVILSFFAHTVAWSQSNEGANAEQNDISEDDQPLSGVLRDKEITIAAGDTFMSLSRKEFDTIGLWRLIAEYNSLDISKPLIAGQLIKIPGIYYRPREFAQIIYAHGNNQYFPGDGSNQRELVRDDKIYLNDAVETGRSGFVTVQFRSGAVVNLQPSSHVKLVKLGCLESDPECFIEINSDQGEMSATVPKNEDQENVFRIHTPHTSAAVRGTTFDFVGNDNDLIVGVTDGTVALSSSTAELELPLGFGVKAVKDTPFGDPVPLLPTTNFRSIAPRVAEDDLISAVILSDASSYIWRLTSDATGNSVLDKSSSSSPIYTVGSVSAGDYFLSVRGVDADGIKGFDKQAQVSIADIDDSYPQVILEASRNNQDLTINVIEPVSDLNGYEVQLSLDSNFADPVSVDIGNSGVVIFAQQPNTVFVRARGLVEPQLVTPFGPTLLVE